MIETKKVRRGVRRWRPATGVGVVALLVMWGAVTASSAVAAPSGEYAVFSDCPLSNTELTACISTTVESGEFSVGSEKIPIGNPIVLQGGLVESRGVITFVGATDGNTLSKAPQAVPGGLLGSTKCGEVKNWLARIACRLLSHSRFTALSATMELAAPASSIGLNEENVFAEAGTALSLPVKVRLENPLLGKDCYIGSNTNPIVLELITGTTSPPSPNTPIKGSAGRLSANAEGTILTVSGNSLVDNSFATPAATGCGGALSFLIDPLIDSKLGLPSAAGHNTAILNNTVRQAGAEAVAEAGR